MAVITRPKMSQLNKNKDRSRSSSVSLLSNDMLLAKENMKPEESVQKTPVSPALSSHSLDAVNDVDVQGDVYDDETIDDDVRDEGVDKADSLSSHSQSTSSISDEPATE